MEANPSAIGVDLLIVSACYLAAVGFVKVSLLARLPARGNESEVPWAADLLKP
jgi:hypothetical protein